MANSKLGKYTTHQIQDLSKTGIYAIVNKISGKFYIGSAAQLGKCPSDSGFYSRWYTHLTALEFKKHHCDHLQKSWNKYGADAFRFQILEFADPKKCIEVEQMYLDLFPVGDREIVYNTCFIAGNCQGMVRTKNYKDKMALSCGSEEVTLISPFWKEFTCISRRDFAQRYNLHQSHLGRVINKEISSHKGWYRKDNPKIPLWEFRHLKSKRVVKTCHQVSFARRYNLDPSSVSKLIKGKIRSINGWVKL